MNGWCSVRFDTRRRINSMIAALGVMLFLEAVAQNIWGPEFRHMDTPYGGVVSLFGLPVTGIA